MEKISRTKIVDLMKREDFGAMVNVKGWGETAYFLIRVMPVMFIPAAAGITEAGKELGNIWLPALIAVTAVTMAVTAVSALAAQKACRKRRAE